jgi:hypothetical protein
MAWVLMGNTLVEDEISNIDPSESEFMNFVEKHDPGTLRIHYSVL